MIFIQIAKLFGTFQDIAMSQARLVNERSLLLPDVPMFHKKRMKIGTIILIIISIVTIITLIIIIILIMI